MNKVLPFLDHQYDEMVTSAIRLSNQGERLDFSFSLTNDEVKKGTGLVRLRQEVITYIVDFFKGMHVDADWDRKTQSFRISLNIIKASFTPSQARLLSTLWKKNK